MSGGFFRGTSAEQDTRFSNKQAKLMKSQKFPPELEHLVDMTKVKMDVMRPWIANRVTELIGFEDEVLINFIYGLLEGKVVNGKEVQISLTGFMERNTGRFMKELWVLLLSAQKNASGVPQQFLDAKEEETKKKKAESDRITNEIQRRKDKESREIEQEKSKKDAGGGVSKNIDVGCDPSSKEQPANFISRPEKEKQTEERNGSRGRRYSRSPLSADRSSSPRGTRSRSPSKSISNSGSHSNGRRGSRSLSASPARRRPHSPLRNRFSPKLSRSPRRRFPRRSLTPPRHRSSYYRRRSLSQSGSPSPRYRVRSPLRRRSRSPMRRRSRSPLRRRSRSLLRRRSRSPYMRRSRSPTRRSPSCVSPSPVRVRSPRSRRSPVTVRRRSPSPARYRSQSPLRRRYRRSPSTPRRRSPSPVRRRAPYPRQRRSPSPANHNSPSPQSSPSAQSRSLTPVERKSPKRHRLPVDSSRERMRKYAVNSPVRDVSPEPSFERSVDNPRKFSQRGQGDSREPGVSRRKVKASSPSPHKSLSLSEAEEETSPTEARRSSGNPVIPSQTKREKISRSFAASPQRESKDSKPIHPASKEIAAHKETDNMSKDGLSSYRSSPNNSKVIDHKDSHGKSRFNGALSPGKISGHLPDQTSGHRKIESNSKDRVLHSGKTIEKDDHLKKPSHQDQRVVKDALSRDAPAGDGHGTAKKKQSHSDDIKTKDRPVEDLTNSSRKVEQNAKSGSLSTGSEDDDEKKAKIKEKSKSKRPRDLESDDESSFDSYEEERKEAKRRRREEKKLRKEERRRKRQERRRKKEEKRAKKKAPKSDDSMSSPSDTLRYNNSCSDDEQNTRRRGSGGMGMGEAESEQKKLEMQLREKALESLRAKKGIRH